MIKSMNTAISRKNPSLPVRDIIKGNLIRGTVLDYGCGKGKDMEFLTAAGYAVEGYDKYHKPEFPVRYYDTILCTYVLNVIDNIKERRHLVMNIVGMLREGGNAIITTRTKEEVFSNVRRGGWTGRNDGFLSKLSTFQKGFSVEELFDFICEVINKMKLDITVIRMSPNTKTAKYAQVMLVRN